MLIAVVGNLGRDEKAITQEGSSQMAEGYKTLLMLVVNRRRFFLTRKGFMGLGPGSLRDGNWVAVLLRADVPFCAARDRRK